MLIWIIVIPILLYLAIALTLQVYSHKRCAFYRDQGFSMIFDSILGHFTLFMIDPKKDDPTDHLSKMKKILTQTKDNCPGIVLNDWRYSRPLIFLKDFELVKELFFKEQSVTNRFERDKATISFSFFFKNSQHSMEMRTAFSEVFRIDFIEKMAKLTRESAENQIKSFFEDGKKEQIVDFKHISLVFLLETSPKILFGEHQNYPKVNNGTGKIVTQEIYDTLSDLNSMKGNFSIINILFWGIPSKFNLTPFFRECSRRSKEIQRTLIRYYKERCLVKEEDLGHNVMDIIVRQNKHERRFNDEEIVGWVVLFLFAGTDTTGKMIENISYFLAKNPEVQTKLRSEINEKGCGDPNGGITFEKLDSLVVLDAVVKESLRLASPAPFLFEKIAIKDFTLGKYQFRKGDLINVPLCYFNVKTQNFQSGPVFNIDNFLSQEGKQVVKHPEYQPFSMGKRSCIGKYLAEMTMKVFTISLIQSCELSLVKTNAEEPQWILNKGYELKELKLHCKKIN